MIQISSFKWTFIVDFYYKLHSLPVIFNAKLNSVKMYGGHDMPLN